MKLKTLQILNFILAVLMIPIYIFNPSFIVGLIGWVTILVLAIIFAIMK